MERDDPRGAPAWQALVDQGLAVRWTTMAEGLRAARAGRGGLTVGDVAAWAEARVEAEPDQPAEVYELLEIPTASGNDRESLARVEPVVAALAAGEGADAVAERAKWRLVDLVELIDQVERWPLDPADEYDGRACSMWSACRELWGAWSELLDRPAFFYPGGREIGCYDGRDFDEVVAEYRAWIADERARLQRADAAAAARG